MSQTEYNDWHQRFETAPEAKSPWHELVQKHLDLARDITGKRVLEIGCGRGEFSIWLSKLGEKRPREIVGADFSSSAIEIAKTSPYSKDAGVAWTVADMQALSFADASFDTVVSLETIEHVPDSRKGLAELYRVLKPGGALYLTCPNYFGTIGLYRGYMRLTGRKFTEVGQPINHFTMIPRTLYWLKKLGFSVESIDGRGHYLPFPGRPPIELKALDHAFTKWFALHSFFQCVKK